MADDIYLPPKMFMPELLIPGRKPVGPVKVDPAHWFADKLNCFWYPTEPGVLRDIVGGQDMLAKNDAGSNPGMELDVTPYSTGVVARARGANTGTGNLGYYQRLGSNCWSKGKSIISVLGYCTVHDVDDPGVYDGRLITQDIGGAVADHRWMIGWTQAGSVRTRIKVTGETTWTILTTSGDIVDGDTLLIIGSYDGFSIRVRGFLPDGSIVTSVNTSPADNQELDDDPTINIAALRSAGVASNYSDASLHWAATYSGYITNERGLELLRKPYQFLKPKGVN